MTVADPGFQALLTKVSRCPLWMPDVSQWAWRTPGGKSQGLAHQAQHRPGHANLLWLAMELDEPPQVYDAQQNSLYLWVLVFGTKSQRLPGWPEESVADTAEILTLEQFAQLPSLGSLPLQRLISLAKRKVRYA